MKTIYFLLIISALLFMTCCKNNRLKYPEAKKTEVSDVYFDKKIHDPYRWLEDPDIEETRRWIAEQNRLTNHYLEKIAYREKIKNRLLEIYNHAKINTPVKKAGKYFFLKNNGLQNHDILYYQESTDNSPVELIDPNTLDREGKMSLGEFSVSGDGTYLAFSVSHGGSDWREIYVKNILTGEMLSDTVKWVKFSKIAWFKNGFFYSRYPEATANNSLMETNKNHRIYYHKTGTNQIADELYFENRDFPDRILTAEVTSDEKFLIIEEAESTYGNRLHIKDLTNHASRILQITENFDFENHIIGNIDDKFFLLTNRYAPLYKLQTFNFFRYGTEEPHDLIPESENLLERVYIGGNKLIAKYLVDAHAAIRIFSLNGNYLYKLNLPPLGNVDDFNSTQNDHEAFYTFSSYTSAPTVYQYNTETNESELFFSSEADFNEQDYITELKYCSSKDGTRIPLYISHKKGLEKNGNNPLLLFGYGGFNISLLPRFYPYLVFWLENGGIFVNANIRGGGEYGEEWHKAGAKLNKQNVFDDFIAAAEFLVQEKYTNPEKLAIEGRSNGGLLIGAVVNQRPDLFKVALPAVGVMDMLRFGQFTIGWAWESDYGSVNNRAEFENLLNISPLHNINSGVEYPAILATTAERDDRVVPAHSFKYIATLQEKVAKKNPVLIRIQTNAGHGAGKPVNIQIEERADILSFMCYHLKINLNSE